MKNINIEIGQSLATAGTICTLGVTFLLCCLAGCQTTNINRLTEYEAGFKAGLIQQQAPRIGSAGSDLIWVKP